MILVNTLKKRYHSIKVPNIDITNYLSKSGNWHKDCQQVAEIFAKFGLLIIKDPRVNAAQNDRFLDLMERYFSKRSKQFQQGNKTIDFAPQSNFQVGIMHEFQQKFQSYKQQKQKLKDPHKSVTPITAARDPKWRFHWKVNYQKNVIPSDLTEWEAIMNEWGTNMKNGCLAVAEMAAIGLDLQPNYLSNTIINGDFMLSPTAVDLQKAKRGDVLAGFHRDFDLLTIHGKARFPGLFAWLNTGQRFMVQVPQGHLLVQAGKQLQWFTGGHIKAGFHEVVYTSQVEEAKQKAKMNGKALWRISSTMFCQVQDSIILQPHKKFVSKETDKLYPPISAIDYLNTQLYSLTQQH